MTEAELRMALLKIDLLLKRRQAIWEILKALAALAAAAAIFLGFVLAGSNWLHPAPQQITVHLDQPIAVQIVPPKGVP